jgi:hypothetical protein
MPSSYGGGTMVLGYEFGARGACRKKASRLHSFKRVSPFFLLAILFYIIGKLGIKLFIKILLEAISLGGF